jgi:hypothetical protein
MAAQEANAEHGKLIAKANNALSKFQASGGLNTDVLTELADKHFPDGHNYKLGRNDKTGEYVLLQTDTGRSRNFKDQEEVVRFYSTMLSPDVYLAATNKANAVGLEAGAKLPSEIALDNAKTDNMIRRDNATGVTAKNKSGGKGSGNGYKVEGSEVATVLGIPAVDDEGKPLTDPLTGRQIVNRNIEAERKFYQWMQKMNITDTNEALARYMALPENRQDAAAPKQYSVPLPPGFNPL